VNWHMSSWGRGKHFGKVVTETVEVPVV